MDAVTTQYSPYPAASRHGLWLGICTTAIFLLSVAAENWPTASLPALALIVTVPLLLLRWMKHTIRTATPTVTLWHLWVQGIMTVLWGSLLSSAIAVAWLKWADPTLLTRQLQTLATTTPTHPSLEPSVQLARQMIQNHTIPPVTTWVMAMWWLMMSSGCILTGILAAIVHITHRKN